MSLLPAGSGYVDAGVAATRLRGVEGWLEAGWHLQPGLAVYGQGYLSPTDAGVMAGARWAW